MKTIDLNIPHCTDDVVCDSGDVRGPWPSRCLTYIEYRSALGPILELLEDDRHHSDGESLGHPEDCIGGKRRKTVGDSTDTCRHDSCGSTGVCRDTGRADTDRGEEQLPFQPEPDSSVCHQDQKRSSDVQGGVHSLSNGCEKERTPCTMCLIGQRDKSRAPQNGSTVGESGWNSPRTPLLQLSSLDAPVHDPSKTCQVSSSAPCDNYACLGHDVTLCSPNTPKSYDSGHVTITLGDEDEVVEEFKGKKLVKLIGLMTLGFLCVGAIVGWVFSPAIF